MHKLIPFGSLFALIIGVFVVMTLAGVFDDGEPQAGSEGVSALCAEGFEDCVDTIVVSDGDDDASGLPAGSRDDLGDAPRLGDEEPEDLPISNNPGDRTADESLAIEAAFDELDVMDGPPSNEVEVSGVTAVDWPSACLGVDTPGIACAQVITPGFIVILSGAGDYEFHTDTNGNAVFVAND